MTREDRIGCRCGLAILLKRGRGVQPARCADVRSEGGAVEADHEGGEIVFAAFDGVLESEG